MHHQDTIRDAQFNLAHDRFDDRRASGVLTADDLPDDRPDPFDEYATCSEPRCNRPAFASIISIGAEDHQLCEDCYYRDVNSMLPCEFWNVAETGCGGRDCNDCIYQHTNCMFVAAEERGTPVETIKQMAIADYSDSVPFRPRPAWKNPCPPVACAVPRTDAGRAAFARGWIARLLGALGLRASGGGGSTPEISGKVEWSGEVRS